MDFNVTLPDLLDPAGATPIPSCTGCTVYTVALPFPFFFYGARYTSLELTEYGYATFETGHVRADQPTLPDATEPNLVVAPWWGSQKRAFLSDPVAYVRTLGEAPSRAFVLQWERMRYDPGPFGAGDYAAVLHEGSGVIEFHLNVSNGNPLDNAARSGIEDGSGLVGLRAAHTDETFDDLLGVAFRFTLPLPGAPPGFAVAAGPGLGQLTATWQGAATPPGVPIEGHRVYRSLTATSTPTLIATIGAVHAFTDGTFGNNEQRCYQVEAFSAAGTGPRTPLLCARTFTAPRPPEDLAAQPGPGLGDVSLAWNAPLSNGGTPITYYRVYRADSQGGPTVAIGDVPGSVRAYVDQGLEPVSDYWYEVRAANLVGRGPPSDATCGRSFPWVATPLDCQLPL
jgi:hypothetical protein